MAGMLTRINHTDTKTISKIEYDAFQKEYIFDQLRDMKYGKSFCERFQINDPVVSRLIDEDLARELIEENYIK
jgi:hypothetical protein